jgi:hypothetical protein
MYLLEKIKLIFQLYSITIIIPVVATLMSMLLIGILGVESDNTLSEALKISWVDYYYSGYFLSISAWRWHIFIFFIIVLFVIIDSISE